MKSKKIIVLLLVINFILLGIIFSFISKKQYIIQNKQLVKEMTSSALETSLNSQITALNLEHTEYLKYIQECKTKIATALTSEGLETSDQILLEEMAEKIPNILQTRTSDADATAADIVKDKTAYVNGVKITGIAEINESQLQSIYDSSGIGAFTIDVTTISNYQNLTVDDFIVEITSISYYATEEFTQADSSPKSITGTSKITKSYDNTTGILTLNIPKASKSNSTSYHDIKGNLKTVSFNVYVLQ